MVREAPPPLDKFMNSYAQYGEFDGDPPVEEQRSLVRFGSVLIKTTPAMVREARGKIR